MSDGQKIDLKDLIAHAQGEYVPPEKRKPVEKTTEPKPVVQMSLEELSSRNEWKSLTPKAKRIVGIYIRNGSKQWTRQYDMLAAVKEVELILSPEVQVRIAEELSTNPAVVEVLKLHFGTAVSQLERIERETMNSNNSSEHESNQNHKPVVPSGMLVPEMQAYMNGAMAAAVKEAVSGIFTSLAPVLQSMQLTPEKMNLLKAPYQDPARVARELRESQQTRAQEKELREQTAARQAACPHQDKNQRDSISLMRNFPDGKPRGICVLCHDILTPKMWCIGSPTDPRAIAAGRPDHAFIQEAHKDYFRVERIASMQ